MNKQRRQDIADIIEKLGVLKDEIETALNDEQEYYDNMPESFQAGERGDNAQAAIDELDNALSSVDDAITSLETASE